MIATVDVEDRPPSGRLEPKKRDDLAGCAALLVLSPPLMLGSLLLSGALLHYGWLWFATAVGAPPPPGIVVCAGLCFFAYVVREEATGWRQSRTSPEAADVVERLFMEVFTKAFMLGLLAALRLIANGGAL